MKSNDIMPDGTAKPKTNNNVIPVKTGRAVPKDWQQPLLNI
jgi:hypothetical protein